MKYIKTIIITVVLAGMLCTGCGAVGNIKDYSQAVLNADENNAEKEIKRKRRNVIIKMIIIHMTMIMMDILFSTA